MMIFIIKLFLHYGNLDTLLSYGCCNDETGIFSFIVDVGVPVVFDDDNRPSYFLS